MLELAYVQGGIVDMTPQTLLWLAIDPALHLLGLGMQGDPARAMLVAIALQESRIKHRRQIGGPAAGFWQFELNGVRGVLNHPASQPHVHQVLAALSYPPETWVVGNCHAAIEHNDVLAAAFSRCLLWTLPGRLPRRSDPGEGWRQYIETWRPGRPHRQTWDGLYERAWTAVEETGP